jgi:MFS-type transporter involved in bile tolerance (Atg22 family)
MLLNSSLIQLVSVLPSQFKRAHLYGHAIGNVVAALLILSLGVFCDSPLSRWIYCGAQIPVLVIALTALRSIKSNKNASYFKEAA